MKRRAVLAGLGAAGAAATAGCTDVLGGEPPLRLRAMRAERDDTDVRCDLSEQLVADHPKLESVLSRAADQPVHEWVTMGVSKETGSDVVTALESHCETAGGLYHYDGEWFFVSVEIVDDELAADHHGGDGHGDHNHSH